MISLQNVNKTFDKDKQALLKVNLTLKQNKIIGLIGKNGAGKTTLLEVILGLLQPTSGEVILGDVHIDDFGYLPDSPTFIEHITVLEMIHYINLVRKLTLTEKDLISKLKAVDLDDNKDTPTVKLSRGMKQRLAYVIATLHAPTVLLLDEPFTGLDPVHLSMMKKHLLDFSKNRCVIFSTHIFSFASKLCNEYIFLDNGEIKMNVSLSKGEHWSEEFIESTFSQVINHQYF